MHSFGSGCAFCWTVLFGVDSRVIGPVVPPSVSPPLRGLALCVAGLGTLRVPAVRHATLCRWTFPPYLPVELGVDCRTGEFYRATAPLPMEPDRWAVSGRWFCAFPIGGTPAFIPPVRHLAGTVAGGRAGMR